MPEVKFSLWNNWDLVSADEREFDTIEEAQEARKEYKKRFEHQGFYRDSAGNHVDLDQIMEHILIRPYDLSWIIVSKDTVISDGVPRTTIEGIIFMKSYGVGT